MVDSLADGARPGIVHSVVVANGSQVLAIGFILQVVLVHEHAIGEGHKVEHKLFFVADDLLLKKNYFEFNLASK